MDTNYCMALSAFILACLFRSVEAAQCTYIFEIARTPCEGATRSDCQKNDCCWDENSSASNLKCYHKDCKPGYFGWGCRFKCNCKDRDPCDPVTGECQSGCPEGNWGPACLLDNNCAYNDNKHEHYLGHLSKTENGHNCIPWIKQRAYTGDKFLSGSLKAEKNYCRNPYPTDHRAWCYYMQNRKRLWDYCVLHDCKCPLGRYGISCKYECHCKDRNEACHQETGECQSGCDSHWSGSGCQACSKSYFGELCQRVCHCHNESEPCDKVTGMCQSGCALGWNGPDCQTECASGRYGLNCESLCNCLDPSEACNKKTGHCISGCRAGYAGTSCQIEIPVMIQTPVSTNQDASSLSIIWPKWHNPPDQGDGPVTGYYLLYRVAGSKNWTKVRADERRYHLHHLPSDTEYQFKVIAIHKEGYSASPSPMLNVSTCGKPQAGPDDIMIRPSEQRSHNVIESPGDKGELSVSWRLPRSPALWGCKSINKFKVYYKSADAEDYENIMEVAAQHVTLVDINLYINYTISVSLVNSAGLESELTTEYYIGKSGPVQNLIAKPTATSLTITWDAPKNSNSHILYYVIRYREQQVGTCPVDHFFWTPKVDLDPDQTTYLIEDLNPYSVYGIRVWAQTTAGKGQFTTITVTTEPSAPSAPIQDFQQVALTSTTAKFTWQPPNCVDRHGEYMGFRYELMDKSLHQIVRQEVINSTELELLGLVPFMEYSLQVSFVNHAYEGPKSLPHIFRTYEDRPPAPRDLAVAETGSQYVIVSWSSPSPPHGVITEYDVLYQLLNESSIPVSVKVEASHHNVTLSRLKADTRYEVKVRAYTNRGEGPWSVAVNFTTEEDVPSEPATFVNISRSTTAVTFRWTPPLEPNGKLLNYKILCSPKSPLSQYLAKALEKEMPSVTLEYQVGGLRPGTGYVCTLKACTRKGCGPAMKKVFFTEPQPPNAPYVPEVQPSRSTDTTITITIQPSDDTADGSERVYRIVVEILMSKADKDRTKRGTGTVTPCGMSDSELPDYHHAKDKGILCYVTAEIDDVDKVSEFTIGDNKTYGQYYNAPLQKGQHYDIWYGLVITVDGIRHSAYTKIDQPIIVNLAKKNPTETSMAAFGAVIGVAIVVIIIIIVLSLLVLKKRKKGCMKLEERSQITDTERMDGSSVAVIADMPDQDHVEEEQPGDISETSPLCDAVPANDHHYKPILVDDLWAYVQEKKANNFEGLRKEYEDIPLGLQHPCEVARRPENKFKNRYGNIIAYDHSRVVLDCIGDDPNSDYINANYIDGYRKPNAFVATQGPSKYTISDIWRMTWQLNSRRIIMVTNLVEDGRLPQYPVDTANQHKCEQYWPEGEPRQYDNILVELVDTEQFADFIIRTFTLTKVEENVTKTVNQLHFTAWPDHGVPNYATSLLAFRKKVRALDDPTAGPTIVHCSAGVGRTGTFIAIDYLLDQAKVEGQVDVYHCVQSMRSKRVNMVQTQEQYNFVYEALLEALKSGDTSISCAVFRRRYRELQEVNPDTGRVRLDEEFELLGTMMPAPDTVCKDAIKPENINKNRYKDIVPVDNLSRAYLLTYIPGSNDYINAVFVDGYKQRDAFIITQMPLPNTVTDFWSMMYDQDCRAIIMMNELDLTDPTCACYYPQDVGSETYGPFAVETISIDTSVEDVIIRDFSLTYNKRGSNETRFVRQFQYTGWPEGSPLPKCKSSVIALLGLVEKWQQRSGNKTIVIHCMDGATKSGLYCAVSYMVERLKVEQEVDVFQSVKHTRINRPKIVSTIEQYRFLYDMAIEYMDCFETYSNFK